MKWTHSSRCKKMTSMITTNVFQRTFRISYGAEFGTCFTIDAEGKQYLITAKHIVEGISDSDSVEIFYDNSWHTLDIMVVGEAPGEADITVLAPGVQLSPGISLPATMDGITWAQDVYFLGFP